MTNQDSEVETEDEPEDDEEDGNEANDQTKEQKTEENKTEEEKQEGQEERETEKEKNGTRSSSSSQASGTQSPPRCLIVLSGTDQELGPQLLEAAANGENHNPHFPTDSVALQSFYTPICPLLLHPTVLKNLDRALLSAKRELVGSRCCAGLGGMSADIMDRLF